MIIAKSGEFYLKLKSYFGEHEYTTHDIEICKITERNTFYTVCSFNKDGEIVSCGDRLLNNINNDDELKDIKKLIEIGEKIIFTERVDNGFNSPYNKSDDCIGAYMEDSTEDMVGYT